MWYMHVPTPPVCYQSQSCPSDKDDVQLTSMLVVLLSSVPV